MFKVSMAMVIDYTGASDSAGKWLGFLDTLFSNVGVRVGVPTGKR
jgi:hypothetical protein